MTWLKQHLKYERLLLCWSFLFLAACGVKGDPLPPERPTQLGRGRPTYRRATEGIKLEKHPSVREDDEDTDESTSDEENE